MLQWKCRYRVLRHRHKLKAATPERETFLLFTSPYISYPSVIITKEDAPFIGGLEDLRGRKVAAVTSQVVHTKLTKGYPHLQLDLVETKNTEKDLEAISFGRAEACIMDLGIASHLIEKLRLTNLKVAAPTDLGKIQLAIGVRKDWPILQTILEKSLCTIDHETKAGINQQWIRLKYQPGILLELVLRWGGILGETYIQENTDAQFSHGICPECIHTLYPGMAEQILENHEPPEKVGSEGIL